MLSVNHAFFTFGPGSAQLRGPVASDLPCSSQPSLELDAGGRPQLSRQGSRRSRSRALQVGGGWWKEGEGGRPETGRRDGRRRLRRASHFILVPRRVASRRSSRRHRDIDCFPPDLNGDSLRTNPMGVSPRFPPGCLTFLLPRADRSHFFNDVAAPSFLRSSLLPTAQANMSGLLRLCRPDKIQKRSTSTSSH